MSALQWVAVALIFAGLGIVLLLMFGISERERGYPRDGDAGDLAVMPPRSTDSGAGEGGGSNE